MKLIFNRGLNSLPQLFYNVHFNDNRPNYHNIYASNIKSKHLYVYDGVRWKLADKHRTIDDIIDKYEDVIETRYYDLKDELEESTIRKLDRFIEQYCEPDMKERYKDDLILLMYNNKHKINKQVLQIENK